MPATYYATTVEGTGLSRNAEKREILKTLRFAKLESSGSVLCFPEHLRLRTYPKSQEQHVGKVTIGLYPGIRSDCAVA